MKLARRKFLYLAAGAVALPAVSRLARAQAYPTRPVTMIVPVAAGGPADRFARIVAQGMGSWLGQTVIIENVTGADGSIGIGRTARARPDGYTIDFGILSTHVLNGAFYSLPYDVLNDFVPIVPLVRWALILLGRRTLPTKDFRELIGYLKANPNKATAAAQLVGLRLLGRYFQQQTATQFTLVPYRGSAPALQDLLAGQLDLLFDTPDNGLPHVQAGGLRAYAVTSDTRLAWASDIPTFAEMGLPALSYAEWGGLFAPKGTSLDIIAKLNAAAMAALADPAIKVRIGAFGPETFPRAQQTPEVLAALVKADAEKWWPIIKEFGIKVE
jgi:tripartite-type tricarboxylate transporter receptor subunit TctC